ncbi:Vacuolar protein 8 [Dissophora globulifera]|uniref:Vacuolar protein 8 n=1 Tax=Dissophora globulifera TaxID=979702 RepID=A0A9P6R1Z7_9FUNG|nr:Vacuolar protein 8 [Dissophora globulifera]
MPKYTDTNLTFVAKLWVHDNTEPKYEIQLTATDNNNKLAFKHYAANMVPIFNLNNQVGRMMFGKLDVTFAESINGVLELSGEEYHLEFVQCGRHHDSVLDPDRESRYILWEDIRQQFGNVQYVMNDGVMIPFMRDANYEDILPQRIEIQQGVTLEVVLQESKRDVDDDTSSMPDLELLSIADPDLKHKLGEVHLGGASDTQKGFKNATDANEVKAMYYLMRHMKEYGEKVTAANFLEGEPLRMMSTLASSRNIELQRMVARYYLSISTEVHGPVSENALKPLLSLLQSNDLEVQQSTTAAIYRLSVNGRCLCVYLLFVPVRPQMVRLGALAPLVRLVQTKDTNVQTYAAGALKNISICKELVKDVVNSGAVPLLISLLGSSASQVIQQQCAEALRNISYTDIGKEKLLKSNTKLVHILVKLSSSTNSLLRHTVTKIEFSLSTDKKFQNDLIKEGGIPPLLRLLESDTQSVVLSPICCLYNISVDPKNRALFAQPRIIKRLIDLQTRFEYEQKYEQINNGAVSILSNLATYKENHKMIVDAGIAERFYSSVSSVPKESQIQMTTLLCQLTSASNHLAFSLILYSSQFRIFAPGIPTSIQTVNTKSMVVRLKLIDAFIELTKSSDEELQMQALNAMAGMASILPKYSSFQKAWHGPDHNLQKLLCRMLESSDVIILSQGLIAIAALLEGGDSQMLNLVYLSDTLRPGMLRMMRLAGENAPVLEGSGSEFVLLLAKGAMELLALRLRENGLAM